MPKIQKDLQDDIDFLIKNKISFTIKFYEKSIITNTIRLWDSVNGGSLSDNIIAELKKRKMKYLMPDYYIKTYK
ncbi:MAG: hypothetical protein ACYDDE_00570 [bacterium]